MKYYFVKNEEKTRNTNYKIEAGNYVDEKIMFVKYIHTLESFQQAHSYLSLCIISFKNKPLYNKALIRAPCLMTDIFLFLLVMQEDF